MLNFLKTGLILSLIVTLSACQTSRIEKKPSESTEKEEEIVKGVSASYQVALLLPLSGQNAALGKSLRQAAEMSLFDGADVNLRLLPLDTKGTPAGTQEATKIALSKDVDIILGPVFSQNAQAMKPLLQASRVPVVTYSTDLSLAEPGFFVFGFDVIEQIRAIMHYAIGKDITSIVAILPNNQYGSIVEKELQTLSSMGHLTMRKILKYESVDRDFAEIAAEIKASDAQGLFIPEGGTALRSILASLRHHDVDLKKYQLLGTGQWDSPQVLQIRDAEDGWFANPSMGDRITFEGRYSQTYGHMPHRLASLAYDSVSMVAALARSHKENPFTIDSMTQSHGFVGVDGLFRILPGGDTQRSLAIFQIENSSLKTLQDASQSF